MIRELNNNTKAVLTATGLLLLFTSPVKMDLEFRLALLACGVFGGAGTIAAKEIQERCSSEDLPENPQADITSVAVKPAFRSVVKTAVPIAVPESPREELPDLWAEPVAAEKPLQTATTANWWEGE